MSENEIKRLPRLTGILTLLQSGRILTATGLSDKYNVSVRTIYRDIRALEQAGVPVVSLEGKGYTLVDGYRLPPIMFTEDEANALVTAGQLLAKNRDASFVKELSGALEKIRAVMRGSAKERSEFLAERVVSFQNYYRETTSSYLSVVQSALLSRHPLKIEYTSDKKENTCRVIEPFAIYSTVENWVLIAWCRLRNDFREFRLDRIEALAVLPEVFEVKEITLQEYFENINGNHFYP